MEGRLVARKRQARSHLQHVSRRVFTRNGGSESAKWVREHAEHRPLRTITGDVPGTLLACGGPLRAWRIGSRRCDGGSRLGYQTRNSELNWHGRNGGDPFLIATLDRRASDSCGI